MKKFRIRKGNKLVENSRIKIPKPHAHFHIIGRKSTKFQVNLMKMLEELGRQFLERPAAGLTHTRMDEGHFYSPPMPMSGDNKVKKKIIKKHTVMDKHVHYIFLFSLLLHVIAI